MRSFLKYKFILFGLEVELFLMIEVIFWKNLRIREKILGILFLLLVCDKYWVRSNMLLNWCFESCIGVCCEKLGVGYWFCSIVIVFVDGVYLVFVKML